jgi:hypothetical protein
VPRVVDDHMRAYYDRRAPEYDDWWLGTGRFEDRERPGWDEEVEQLVALLRGLPPTRTLNDGSQHEVYKRWFSGAALAEELGGGEVLFDGRWLVVVRT